MATDLTTIGSFLDEMGIKYVVKDDKRPRILTGFKVDNYRDSDGDPQLNLVIELTENGEYLKLYAPNCYTYKEGPHKRALFEACLALSWRTKLIQFEYDPSDGEVRCIIEWPLEDAPLTKRQLERSLKGIVSLIDENHVVLSTAMETGNVVFPDKNQSTQELRQQLHELLRMLDERENPTVAPAAIDLEE